nr:hypothetical protein [Kofleriaceae bacterium]
MLFAVVMVILAALAARASAQTAPADAPSELDDLDDAAGVVVVAPGGGTSSDDEVDAEIYARIAASAPKPDQVVAAAYRAAGVDRDPVAHLVHRAHLAALVPQLSVRGGEDASWREIDDPTIARVMVFDVSASWHFDRLVFDPTDVRAVSLETGRRRERRRVASRVIRTYYRWLAARAIAVRAGRPSPRADEAAAELDAWTDGWWSTETCRVANCPPRSDRSEH